MTEVQTRITDPTQLEFTAANPEDLRELLLKELAYKESEHPEKGLIFKKFKLEGMADDSDTVIAQLSKDNFRVYSKYNDYSFDTFLRPDDDILHITVRLVRKSGNQETRNPYLPHYSGLFTAAINYFEGMERNIAGIRGVWNPTLNDTENTNYTVYQTNLSTGASEEKAALATPTGKLAMAHGYTHPVFADKSIHEVDVVFYKNPPVVNP